MRTHARASEQTRSVCVFVYNPKANNKQFYKAVFALAINTRLRHRHASTVDVFGYRRPLFQPITTSFFRSAYFIYANIENHLAQVDRPTNKQINK